MTISMGGTWGNLSGSDASFVSNEPWTLAFQVANPPMVGTSDAASFRTSYSNVVYTLNGSPVAAPGNEVFFYTSQSFDICLDPSWNFQIGTFGGSPALFSGTTANPTIVPASYATDSNGFAAHDVNTLLGTASGVHPISVTPQGSTVPEPSTFMLTGAGVMLGWLYRSRHKEATA